MAFYSHSHFRPKAIDPNPPKKRKWGRYLLLIMLIGITAIWWGPKLKSGMIHLFKSTSEPSEKSKTDKKKIKSTSSSAAISSITESSSSLTEATPSPTLREWKLKKGTTEWIVSYRFEVQDEWNVVSLPAQVHGPFVEQILSESRQKCGNKPISITIHTALTAPYVENEWSYQCGDQLNSYKLVNPNSGAWLAENGCRKSAPCWNKPMASFIPVSSETVGKLSFLRFKPTVASTVISPERLQVKSIEKSNGQITLHLQKGYSWRVDLKGFMRLNPAVEVGQIFEKGAPLGESSGTWPLDFVIYYQGQNWPWNQAYQYSYPRGAL